MIAPATEGWTALYGYNENDQQVVLARQVALWWYREEGERSGGYAIVGMVVDDLGHLEPANLGDRFICYCSPDDNPQEIIKRRAMSEKPA